MRRLRIFTWHIHGSYLFYLSHISHDIFVPFNTERSIRYCGRLGNYPWPDNLHEIPVEMVKNCKFDCIIFQHSENFLRDQFNILSSDQRQLPSLYIEHNPPRKSPTDTVHPAGGTETIIVHVTHFNALMWDNKSSKVAVIEHGVQIPANQSYSGQFAKGLVVVNNLKLGGRRLGLDIFENIRLKIPLDLIGVNSKDLGGGIGEVAHDDISAFSGTYRFLFNPIRYTSLGLAILEAMGNGLPVVGLATNELVSVIENNKSGYLSNNLEDLIDFMTYLLEDKDHAAELGRNARQTVQKRYSISRFIKDWEYLLCETTENSQFRDNSPIIPESREAALL